MSRKRQVEDNYSPEHEDFVAGRLERHKELALQGKKIRTYLIAHPGSILADIRKGTGIEKPQEALSWLIVRGFIRNSGLGWEAKPL